MDKFNKLISSVHVKSLANGNYLVECKYKEKPVGLFPRLAIAEELMEILNVTKPCDCIWEPADSETCKDGEICKKCLTIRPKE